MSARTSTDARGFSLVELLVALTVSLLVTSAVFAMLDPGHGAFRIQPEQADVAQRLRAAADALLRDVEGAGGWPFLAEPLPASALRAAAVLPLRRGRRNADPPGTFDSSRLSVWQVTPSAPQARLASALASSSGTTTIVPGAGCASGDPSCGFRAGMLVAAFDGSGGVDLFSVTGVSGTAITLQHNDQDSAHIHAAGRTILAVLTARTYFFRHDPALGYGQVRRYDADGSADLPVANHVVSLSFEYFGDPEPPRVVSGAGLQRATYGPLPPQVHEQPTAYPPGENCAFMRTAGGAVASRLPVLSGSTALVPLSPSLLADGPWCPDDTSPNRYDADLLRVRQIVATIRVEAAVDALRGPAGPLFTRAGTGAAPSWVPDRETRIVVAPPALGGGR
ncbi:MAG: PilW family protein [Vicinamibacterales bacterium]